MTPNPVRETRGSIADPRRRLYTCGRPGVVVNCPCRKCATGAIAKAYSEAAAERGRACRRRLNGY